MLQKLTRKIIKYCFVVVLLFALLLGLGLYFINDLVVARKSKIEQYLSEATATEVTFEQLSFAFTPLPRIQLENARATHQQTRKVLVHTPSASLNIKLLPLLYKEIVIAGLTLDSPVIDIDTADFAGGENTRAGSKETKTPTGKTAGTSSNSFQISLQSLTLKKAKLNYNSPDFSIVAKEISSSIKGVALNARQAGQATAHSFSLSSLAKSFAATGAIDLKGLSIKYAGDNYGAAHLRGPLKLKSTPEKGIRFGGKVELTDFEYGFPNFAIEKVNASISDIEGSIDTKNNISISLQLDGDSFSLQQDSIAVPEITSVSVPLRIDLPAAGSYSVSGPVTINGGIISILDEWTLTDVNGTVDLLVTEPLVEVKGTDFSMKSGGESKKLSTRYRLTEDGHSIDNTRIDFERSGSIEATTTIEKTSGIMKGEAKAENLRIAELAALLAPGSTMEDTFLLKAFDAEYSAELSDVAASLTGTGVLTFLREECGKGPLINKLFDAVSSIPPFSLLTSNDAEELTNCPGGVEFNILNEQLLIKKSKLELARANLKAKGSIGFDKSIELDARLLMARESAATLGLGISRLKKLFGKVAEITIPIDIHGNLPDPSISVDKSALITDSAAVSMVTGTLGGIRDLGSSVGNVITGTQEETVKEKKPKRKKRFKLKSFRKKDSKEATDPDPDSDAQ